ncbi:MAG: ABC transporter substrate-binding protein [Porticoccaceae bacterium]|nr:ABC transporter substrate-binding protein [Porticoccaceae bacterium]
MVISSLVSAAPVYADSEQAIRTQFSNLFKLITQELSTSQATYLRDAQAYEAFIDARVKSSWDVASTARALVGKSVFDTLAPEIRQSLVNAVDRTLVRYAFEGLDKYSGQTFDVVDLVVNQEAGMGWVQLLVQSPLIPDVNLDLLIKRNLSKEWKAVDIRFQGITYVMIKKREYRAIIEQQGIAALIEQLVQANQAFFNNL